MISPSIFERTWEAAIALCRQGEVQGHTYSAATAAIPATESGGEADRPSQEANPQNTHAVKRHGPIITHAARPVTCDWHSAIGSGLDEVSHLIGFRASSTLFALVTHARVAITCKGGRPRL